MFCPCTKWPPGKSSREQFCRKLNLSVVVPGPVCSNSTNTGLRMELAASHPCSIKYRDYSSKLPLPQQFVASNIPPEQPLLIGRIGRKSPAVKYIPERPQTESWKLICHDLFTPIAPVVGYRDVCTPQFSTPIGVNAAPLYQCVIRYSLVRAKVGVNK